MTKYMYFSAAKNAPSMYDQNYVANKEKIPINCRFGKGQAIFSSCRSLSKALDNKFFLKQYDTVLVVNALCISSKHSNVLKTIKKFHDKKVCLMIYDLKYHDKLEPREDGSTRVIGHDYALLYSYLDSFETIYKKAKEERNRRKEKKAALKTGRKKQTLDDLPQDVYAIIEKYCVCSDRSYRLKDLDKDLDKLGHHMGAEKRMRLIGEYRERFGTPSRK